jgi:hypothetical protein
MVLAVVLAAAVPLLQKKVDTALGSFRAQEEALYLASGEQVRRLVPGFESLVADLYWIRTVQYFGSQRVFAADKRFDLLEPLINITTTLDPKFEIAYRYGAIFLSEPSPMGAGRPEAGITLLEKGARELPRAWYLQQNLGFFTYFFLKDPQRAARNLLRAANEPGAPIWLSNMAVTFLSEGGEREVARRLWRQIYETQEEGMFKANAMNNLQRLDALDAVDAWNRALQSFEARAGRPPSSLKELAGPGAPAVPMADPAGVPYRYDPGRAAVEISPESPLWRQPFPTARPYEGFPSTRPPRS